MPVSACVPSVHQPEMIHRKDLSSTFPSHCYSVVPVVVKPQKNHRHTHTKKKKNGIWADAKRKKFFFIDFSSEKY